MRSKPQIIRLTKSASMISLLGLSLLLLSSCVEVTPTPSVNQSGVVSDVPPPRDTPPPTSLSTRCDVNYFNNRFDYGFDLPFSAQIYRMNETPAFLFDAIWVQSLGTAQLGFITTVLGNVSESTTSLAIGLNQSARNRGAVFIVEEPFTLSDGGPAYFSQYIDTGAANYRVDAIRNGIAYNLLASVDEDELTPRIDLILFNAAVSLCVE